LPQIYVSLGESSDPSGEILRLTSLEVKGLEFLHFLTGLFCRDEWQRRSQQTGANPEDGVAAT
jgi:hypothetical protein